MERCVCTPLAVEPMRLPKPVQLKANRASKQRDLHELRRKLQLRRARKAEHRKFAMANSARIRAAGVPAKYLSSAARRRLAEVA